MNTRQFLAAYTLLDVGVFLYSALRYEVLSDASYWLCFGFNALVLVLLFRGSRGAWLLSFLGSSLALVYGVDVLPHENVLTLEWAFIFVVYTMQVLILVAPQIRHYVRRASYERA